MQQLSLKQDGQVALENSDILLNQIIGAQTEEKNDEVEKVITVLQQGFRTKQPFCPYANLAGDNGMRLSRATFSVMLKFSDRLAFFNKLTQSVTAAYNNASGEQNENDKIKKVVQVLKAQKESKYDQILKQWE